jgi:multidrug resistance efflux pump
VQNVKCEVIKENDNLGEDRWVYDHLVRKGDHVEKSVGESFDLVARQLNKLKHVKKVDRVTGRITIQRPNKRKIKYETGQALKRGLDGLLRKYKQKCNV